jgi:hypothetical protein
MALLDELARAAIWPMAPKKKLGKSASFQRSVGYFY